MFSQDDLSVSATALVEPLEEGWRGKRAKVEGLIPLPSLGGLRNLAASTSDRPWLC
jgi:hypothetical protein